MGLIAIYAVIEVIHYCRPRSADTRVAVQDRDRGADDSGGGGHAVGGQASAPDCLHTPISPRRVDASTRAAPPPAVPASACASSVTPLHAFSVTPLPIQDGGGGYENSAHLLESAAGSEDGRPATDQVESSPFLSCILRPACILRPGGVLWCRCLNACTRSATDRSDAAPPRGASPG